MKHVEQNALILFFYGEHESPEQVRAHLDGCERCALEYGKLEQLLGSIEAAPVPERDEAYAGRVWAALQPQLQPRRVVWLSWFALPRLALAGGMAALLLAAFLFGNYSGKQEGMSALSAEARERILMHVVGEHLERSERALVELTNVKVGPGIDLGEQRERAARLAAANRVYRTSAQNAGEDSMALLLDQLERVLLEIANSPEAPAAAEFNRLWRCVEGSGLLIKLKLMGTETRQRAERLVAPANRT